MIEVSTSEVRCYQSCREKHRFRYVLRRRPHRLEERDPRSVGRAFHEGLELGHEPQNMTLDPYDAAKVGALLRGYFTRYEGDGLETIAHEQTFKVDRGEYFLVGAIDRVVRDGAGEVSIMESKTSGEDITPGSDYWVTKTIDDQVSNYLDGAQSLGFEADACIYDVTYKSRLKPLKATPPEKQRRTKFGDLYKGQREEDENPAGFALRILSDIAESPDKYYQRAKIVRLDGERRRARADMLRIVQDIKRTHEDIPEPRNPGACRAFNRLCEYFDVCSGVASINDDGLYRTAEAKHEELQT